MSIEQMKDRLLAEATESAERVSGPERLAGVRAATARRRDVRRRRGVVAGTTGLAVAAVAATVLVLAGGAPWDRADVQPAAPSPTGSVEQHAERAPGEVYADVAAALADRGIELVQPMRWGAVDALPDEPGSSVEDSGPGLRGVGIVAAQGAEITVSTWRVTGGGSRTAAGACAGQVAPEVECQAEQTSEGTLARLTSDELGITGAQLVTGEHVVTVMSHLSGSPSAQGTDSPAPLDVELLAELAQDPRLRR